mmetsp:Transcript_71950/g.188564  ORF Transcript_71950/g.188564 Transcript_71950/m.188564 type:complete len:336 (+) Transcript_71950:129-1136(+)
MPGSGRSSARTVVPKKWQPPDAESLATKNYYDRSRVTCTCDDRKTAAQLGGHTWNVINNRSEDEVFLLHARNNDHFVDDKGNITSQWFEKKKRVDLDGDGVMGSGDSRKVEEIMRAPPTAGKRDKQLQLRMARQLYQAAEPTNFGAYSARRHQSLVAPPTPRREGPLERTVPFQDRIRDPAPRPTPQVVERQHWTPRRGEPRNDARPPAERDMYRNVDQLRTVSHISALDPSFAESLMSARGTGALGVAGGSAVAGASTLRSSVNPDLRAKPAHEKTHFSRNRLEDTHLRDISGWPSEKHSLKKEDLFHSKPQAQTGSSSVKYDLISNQQKEFWY